MIGEIRQNFTEASASVGLILATALPQLWLVTFSTCLPRQVYMHQKSTSDIARKHEKTLNWSVQWLKSPVITIKSKVFKILTYINLFSLLWFMLHILFNNPLY